VQQGESVTITVGGVPVATLNPIGTLPTWISKSLFLREVLANQADPDLAQELRELAPDTTDSLPL